MSKKIVLNKTEESIFTVVSLFVLIKQAYQSLTGNEEILESNFDADNETFHDLVTDTIKEALIYQILLKTCAFLDEWNTILGVRTEEKDKERILMIKKLVKPATKQLATWKQLREFRNEAIAHNHRDRNGGNIYLMAKSYHKPEGSELFLMIYCLKKMADVLSTFFQDEFLRSIDKLQDNRRDPKSKSLSLSKTAIKRIKKELDHGIDGPVISILMKQQIIGAMAAQLNKEKVSVTML